MSRALTHQPPAFAQQIAYRTLLFRVNVAGGQDAKPHLLRQPEGIMSIVGVLEPLVLAHLGCVDQLDGITRLSEAIN